MPIFLKVVIVLIHVYNWETRNLSSICRCGLADILYPVKFRKQAPPCITPPNISPPNS